MCLLAIQQMVRQHYYLFIFIFLFFYFFIFLFFYLVNISISSPAQKKHAQHLNFSFRTSPFSQTFWSFFHLSFPIILHMFDFFFINANMHLFIYVFIYLFTYLFIFFSKMGNSSEEKLMTFRIKT